MDKRSNKIIYDYVKKNKDFWSPLVGCGDPCGAPLCLGAPKICLGCPALTTALVRTMIIRRLRKIDQKIRTS